MSGSGVSTIRGVRSYDVPVLAGRAVQALAASTAGRLHTSALAEALGVPFWVADVVMDSLQERGDALHGADGWRLSCSASVALRLSLPPLPPLPRGTTGSSR